VPTFTIPPFTIKPFRISYKTFQHTESSNFILENVSEYEFIISWLLIIHGVRCNSPFDMPLDKATDGKDKQVNHDVKRDVLGRSHFCQF